MPSKIQLLKGFFGTADKPVTSKELIEFAKTDKAGYDKLALEVAEGTGQSIDK